jgi:hypothetical protein
MSSVTTYDDALIRAGVRAIYSKRYHCEKELDKIRAQIKRSGSDERRTALEKKLVTRPKEKGCGYILDREIDRIGNYSYRTCLCKLRHPYFDLLWDMALRNTLPEAGGEFDQPAQTMELIACVRAAREAEELTTMKEKKNG